MSTQRKKSYPRYGGLCLPGTQHNGPFSFNKLPPEVRNIIYRYMFVAEETLAGHGDMPASTVRLVYFIEADRSRLRSSLRLPFDDNPSTSSQRKDRRCKDRPRPTAFDTAILCVGKEGSNAEISRDALSIFYGCNHFRFSKSDTLRLFLKRIGSNARFLRTIELSSRSWQDCWANSVVHTALTPIAKLDSLTSFHVDLRKDGKYRNLPATKLASLLKFLLWNLYIRHGRDIAKVFSIVSLPDADGDEVHKADGMPTFTEELFSIVESYLRLESKPKSKSEAVVRRDTGGQMRSCRAKVVNYTEQDPEDDDF